MADERQRILQGGCNACLSKLIDFTALQKQLHLSLDNDAVSQGASLAERRKAKAQKGSEPGE